MRDLGVTEALVTQVPEPVVPLLVVLTAFGGPKLLAIASIGGSVGGVWSGRIAPDTARRFLVAVALALSASILLKYGFGMPRPPETLMLVPEDGYGFPSGHATATAGVATALVGVARWDGYGLHLLAALAVGVIAATRLLLGVHYLLDVLAGIAVGVIVATAGLRAAQLRPQRTLLGTTGVVAVSLAIWALF
ncbi:hypothetical protein HTSR_1890 [Halodesulfurarchaeum formicicum]|uniref:Phosphatidic acid phosphatase type 2/haloperoxidase domain-containing protein n=1 Tax=Halodesulfurarchaeum formicicum TaxID=1873524 RepID=A0A1D8S6S0_9EURY|nr:phosphatase PAP2 family protein [Halodesulfurarchaeum formicicum]AOW81054.1 hypothetical protein HTSR_1890 [Halodesulfurarchaeum formicicum]